MRHVLPLLAVLAVLAGCESSPINVDAVRPATIADLNALRTDHDGAFKAVAADLDAAKVATANLTPAIRDLDSKAEAAKADAEESTSPLATILTGLASVAAAYFGVNIRRNYTRKAALAKIASPKTSTPA